MGRRLGLAAGLGATLLSLARLDRLLQPQLDGSPWPTVLLAAAVGGGIVTWALSAFRVRPSLVAIFNLTGIAVVFTRIAVSDVLTGGLGPADGVTGELGQPLELAVDLVRFGAAPVIPVPGLVAILTAVFWALGASSVFGFTRSRPLVAALPPTVFYIQLAILDRRSPGPWWILAMAILAALILGIAGLTPNPTAGRLQATDGADLPQRSRRLISLTAALAVIGSIAASQTFASAVPESGFLSWRTQSGIGGGFYGGTSYNLFAGLQQDLLDLSDEPVFYARLSESSPDNSQLYWRLVTLDTFDGKYWNLSAQPFAPQGIERWEREDMRFQGPTIPVTATVHIATLAQPLLPVLYSTTSLWSEVELIRESFRVREDGAITIDVRTSEGWEYELAAEVPNPDLSELASVGGELSPIFGEAAQAGIFPDDARPSRFEPRPENIEHFLELPDDISSTVRLLAREVTADGLTRFEKALVLESWFRDPGEFTYSAEVSTGHSSLDLTQWLTEPSSINYRTGYCEQFATAFAVMARTLGLPSRVVLGFAPGEVGTQADGSEIIVVRDRNAHAWVELWMDGQGWMRFDPTPRSDGINLPTGARLGFDPRAYIPAPEEPQDAEGSAGGPTGRENLRPEIDGAFVGGGSDLDPLGISPALPRWLAWGSGMLALAALTPLFKWFRRRRRMRRIREGDITAAWEEIVDQLRDLGNGVPPFLTPLEVAADHGPELVSVARLYSASVYGGQRSSGGMEAFNRAEQALTATRTRSERLRRWMSPVSLRRGGRW